MVSGALRFDWLTAGRQCDGLGDQEDESRCAEDQIHDTQNLGTNVKTC